MASWRLGRQAIASRFTAAASHGGGRSRRAKELRNLENPDARRGGGRPCYAKVCATNCALLDGVAMTQLCRNLTLSMTLRRRTLRRRRAVALFERESISIRPLCLFIDPITRQSVQG
jgi:hypothetical protein